MFVKSIARSFVVIFSDLNITFAGGSSAPAVASVQDDPPSVDTPKRRRSSRSRTKSPEPIVSKAQDPALASVEEESEDIAQEVSKNQAAEEQNHPDSQMYEKIIDEMDVDDSNAQDVNEDELLAEPEEATTEQNKSIADPQPEEKVETEEKIQTDDENRGTKRRSDSPNKGNTPKKRQRLPPPNIEDFVNDEDEPELDENSIQLSWCKFFLAIESNKNFNLTFFLQLILT